VAKRILNKMKDRQDLNLYLDNLENRLDNADTAKLYRHLPGVIDILLAGPVTLAGPVSGGSTPSKSGFRCPHCKALLSVEWQP
jgi:hypothetical protein